MTHGTFARLAYKLASAAIALLLTAALTACEDEESSLGIALVDPSTLYEGLTCTLYPDAAWSKPEDSLQTSNYSLGIIGNLDDPVFGKWGAVLYSQIALPTSSNSINFDSVIIDSVVLTLTKYRLYPDQPFSQAPPRFSRPLRSGGCNFHFEVKQLADSMDSKKKYYSTDELPVDESTLFFDGVVNVKSYDTVVRLLLDSSFNQVLCNSATAEEFVRNTKGLRIRIKEDSDNGMLSIDFSSVNTCITAYTHYLRSNGDTLYSNYPFQLGTGASHFTHFTHDYSGTALAGLDSVNGNEKLYVEPLGGMYTQLAFDRDLQAFHRDHPHAVVHYAELRLPVASEVKQNVPERIMAMSRDANDSLVYIDDAIDLYTIGYDGTYHEEQGYFRMRVTQHLQGLLREGQDRGLMLLLDARRHTAVGTVINGIGDTATSPRITFVYSE